MGWARGEAFRCIRSDRMDERILNREFDGKLSLLIDATVHEFLESSPYCATFRESEPAGGGAGVTIAELG